MFESALRPQSRSKYRHLLAGGSVAAHLAVGGLFLVLSLWEIHEVNRPSRGVAAAATLGLAPPSGGSEAKAEPKKIERKPERKRVEETRQPNKADKAEDTESASTAGTGSGAGTGEGAGEGTGTGVGTGTGNGTGLGINICLDADLCAPPPIPVKAAREAPQTVPPAVLDALRRTAGEAQIQPPSSTRNAMARNGQSQVTAMLIMCLDKSGAVSKQTIAKSSGYPEYDAKIRSGVKRWRYEPYRANGKPAAICTQVMFVYMQE